MHYRRSSNRESDDRANNYMPELQDRNSPDGVARGPFDCCHAAAKRTVEFFTAHIRNPNTRRAYAATAREFAGWCESQGMARCATWSMCM
jgi:hypothetical protein